MLYHTFLIKFQPNLMHITALIFFSKILKRFISQRVYTVCTRINYKIFMQPISINIYSTLQVELNSMYIDIGANSGSKKLWTKNTATSGKLIKAVYISNVYVYIFCASYSGRLEYNSLFVELGGCGVKGNERIRQWMRTGMGWMFRSYCAYIRFIIPACLKSILQNFSSDIMGHHTIRTFRRVGHRSEHF